MKEESYIVKNSSFYPQQHTYVLYIMKKYTTNYERISFSEALRMIIDFVAEDDVGYQEFLKECKAEGVKPAEALHENTY